MSYSSETQAKCTYTKHFCHRCSTICTIQRQQFSKFHSADLYPITSNGPATTQDQTEQRANNKSTPCLYFPSQQSTHHSRIRLILLTDTNCLSLADRVDTDVYLYSTRLSTLIPHCQQVHCLPLLHLFVLPRTASLFSKFHALVIPSVNSHFSTYRLRLDSPPSIASFKQDINLFIYGRSVSNSVNHPRHPLRF